MFYVEEETQTIELNSKPDSLMAVESLIEEIRDKYAIDEDVFGNMFVALTEAVTNAIYHGNKADPSKKVSIEYRHSPHHITFIIEDEGSGFDYFNLPDPTAPENLEKECGRGVFLMRNLTDQLIFSDNGRIVELNFRLQNN